ncbi:Ig-like domain-containing protein [Aureimonas frigidaquae]|uniref:FG-GAP repeat domain protein n=1 Tax=Aureimonas frigidaquae TaxID=424757 RepID=A0A0P0Z381_9HYPH|nr:Ig-like domain-containing protein [Aureimonas frigidaquae]BAT28466.1 FG-GAP repeat domain protein [Aureimonas frigidaquae]
MAKLDSGTAAPKFVIVSDGHRVDAAQGMSTRVRVKAGGRYKLLQTVEGSGDLKPVEDVVAVASGKNDGGDLILLLDGKTQIVLDDFLTLCKNSKCSIELPGKDGHSAVLDGSSVPLSKASDGSAIYHIAGSASSVTGLTHAFGDTFMVLNDHDTAGTSLLHDNRIPIVLGALAAGGGVALAAGGGSGSSHSVTPDPVDPVTSTVSFRVVAGPVAGPVHYRIIGAKGLVAEGDTDADGNARVVLTGDHSGPLMIVASNITHTDETTGQATQLSTPLRSVFVMGTADKSVVVSPVTELVAQKLGIAGEGLAVTADQVTSVTAAVASALGLDASAGAVTVLDAAYNEADGVSAAELYGQLLARLSGLDQRTGSVADTLALLASEISVSGSTGSLSGTGVALLDQGAAIFESGVNKEAATIIKPDVALDVPAAKLTVTFPSNNQNSLEDFIATQAPINRLVADFMDENVVARVKLPTNAVAGDSLRVVINGHETKVLQLTQKQVVAGRVNVDISFADVLDIGEGIATIDITLSNGGPVSAKYSASLAIDVTAPAAPTAALHQDTGGLDTDFITGNGRVDVSGLENGGRWEYSLDGGGSWTAGSGSFFELAPGNHPQGSVRVRQYDAVDNASEPFVMPAVQVLAPPTLAISVDRSTLLAGQTAQVTFTFSSAPSNFALTDVEVANGTLSDLVATGSPTVFTATLTPAANVQDGTITIAVAQGAYDDLAGNSGAAANLAAPIVVDTSAPSIVSIASTASSGGIAGHYNAGDTIDFTVTFDQAVSFAADGPEPGLPLNVSGALRAASYVGGNGTSELVFRYTVQAGDHAEDGLTIPENALSTHAPLFRDASGNAASLDSPAQEYIASLIIDNSEPELELTKPADQAALRSDTIVLTFDGPVSAGTGAIHISDGAGEVRDIPINDSQVVISGSKVTITLSTPLTNGVSYQLTMPAGVLTDVAGNSFQGIAAGGYAFTREAPIDLNLSQVYSDNLGFRIVPEGPEEVLGSKVTYAGDINGDGIDDIFVAAANNDTGFLNAGRGYVIFGKVGGLGSEVQLSNIAAGSGGFAITGEGAINRPGAYAAAPAGDVNGDGYDDLVLGGATNTPYTGGGRAYVVFGKSDGAEVKISSVSSGNGGFAIISEMTMAGAGYSVGGLGDVNGDGLSDVLISSYMTDNKAGRVHVVYGKRDGTAVNLSDVTGRNGGFAIISEGNSSLAGYAVASAGDVNGDNIADMLISATDAIGDSGTRSGVTYVVFGTRQPTANIQLSAIAAGQGGFVIQSGASNTEAGYSVSTAGDVNGDGYADILLGDLGYDVIGRAYVIFGKSDTSAVHLSSVSAGTGGFAIAGHCNYDGVGISVSYAGDMNGDGLSDIVVGARQSGDNGRMVVVFGKHDTSIVDINTVKDGIGGFAFLGESVSSTAGAMVSYAGDLNGDGLSDVIVAAPYMEIDGDINTGRAYVVFGTTSADVYTTAVDKMGGNGADTLSDDGVAKTLVGGAGNDELSLSAKGSVAYAGAGDDVIIVTRQVLDGLMDPQTNLDTVSRIDGGGGIDTLKIDGTGLNRVIDLSEILRGGILNEGRLANIEVIDMTDGGTNTLRLAEADVLSLSSFNVFETNGKAQLRILGTADTTLDLTHTVATATVTDIGNGWNAVDFTNIRLYVQQAVHIELPV